MRDVLPEQMPAWEWLEATARRLAGLGGYREIRPPLLEETDLFIRSVGEVTDIVEKEMFTLRKGDNSLTLRPEGTAGIARAYVQAGYPKRAAVQKLFTIGPMFRYERPQKGRERQFTQFDVEAIGSLDARLDAEVIDLAAGFFEALGIPKDQIEVRINSMGDGEDRERYKDAVRAFLAPEMDSRCELCRSRFERNVLRVLDCKNPECARLNAAAPRILEFLSAANREHFEDVQRHLTGDIGRAAVAVHSDIVRGLDYYTRTVFEVHHPPLGARSALCGGGRYDHLVRDVGGPDLGAVGFAVGFSSTLIVLEQLGLIDALPVRSADVYVVATEASLKGEVLALAAELRRGGLSAVFDSENKSLKAQMRAAGSGGHALAAILGPDEIQAGSVQLKHMQSGVQSEVPRDELVARARTSLGS
jgi:histidyl-tRNA synthetase